MLIKKQTQKRIIIGALICLCAVFAGINIAAASLNVHQKSDDNIWLREGWYYIDDEGIRQDAVLPETIHRDQDKLDIYYGKELKACGGEFLTFKGANYGVSLYIGDECIYQFKDDGIKRNSLSLTAMMCTVQLPQEIPEGELHLTFNGDDSSKYKIDKVYFSTLNGVYESLFRSNVFSLFMGLLMIVMGLLCISAKMIMKIRNTIGRELESMAWYMMLCGLWSLFDCNFVQIMSDYSYYVDYIAYYLFGTMMLPLLFYVLELDEFGRYYRMFKLFIAILIINVVVQSILDIAGIFTLYQMLVVTQIIYYGMIGVYAFILIRMKRSQKSVETMMFFSAFKALSVFTVVSMLLYMLSMPIYKVIFQIGIVCFIVIILKGLVHEIWSNMQYRATAEYYKRVAEEDSLTKLKNQRAFEMIIYDIKQKPEDYANSIMVFADVNRLKYVNDNFGHEAGNRLLIAAANCIESAYGEYGVCYRIGGDEFCVIMLNPSVKWKFIADNLRFEVMKYNNTRQKGDCELSIAYGASILKNTENVDKWKEDADREMYKNKQRYYESRM